MGGAAALLGAPASPNDEALPETKTLPTLTLEGALARALEVTLAPARERARALIHATDERAADTLNNPVVSTNVGRKDSPDGGGAIFDIAIEQQLPTGGVRGLRARHARESRTVSSLETMEQNLRERVELIDLLAAYAARAHLNNNLKQRIARMQSIRAILTRRGTRTTGERLYLNMLDGRIRGLVRELHGAESATDALWLRANAFLQLEQRHTIRLTWFRGGPQLSLAEVENKAEQQSPMLRRLRAEIRQAEVDVALADARRYPAPALRAFFGAERANPPENFYGIGVTFALPFSSRAGLEKRRAIAVVREKRVQLAAEERRFRAKLAAALVQYGSALRAVTSLPLSREQDLDRESAFAISELERGRLDPHLLVDLEDRADEIRKEIIAAQVGLVQSFTALMILTGSPEFSLVEAPGQPSSSSTNRE